MEQRCPICAYPLLQHDNPPFRCANPHAPHWSEHGQYGLVPCVPAEPVKLDPDWQQNGSVEFVVTPPEPVKEAPAAEEKKQKGK